MSEKNYQIYLNGEFIDVSEETYKAHQRAEWREAKANSRKHRCMVTGKNGRPVLCRGNCSTCTKEWKPAEVSFDSLSDSGFQFVDTNSDPSVFFAKRDLYSRLYTALDELDETSRKIIDGIFFENKTERNLATELGVSQKTVNRRKMAILERLKEKLD